VQTFLDYSVQLKTFYHRYILCDKQYSTAPIFQQNLSHMGYTVVSHRGSYIPPHRQQHHTTSTI
jgi:hypothetical protein